MKIRIILFAVLLLLFNSCNTSQSPSNTEPKEASISENSVSADSTKYKGFKFDSSLLASHTSAKLSEKDVLSITYMDDINEKECKKTLKNMANSMCKSKGYDKATKLEFERDMNVMRVAYYCLDEGLEVK